MRKIRVPLGTNNFLSILEGIEGGFAIFVGLIVGLMFEGVSRDVLILTASIGIIVSAFNSSAVRYSSEHYLDEIDGHEKRHRFHSYFMPALVEFVSYACVAVIALIPLLFIQPLELAVAACAVITLIILFAAGWYRGHLLNRRHAMRDGVEVACLGLLIIAIGGLAGWLITKLL